MKINPVMIRTLLPALVLYYLCLQFAFHGFMMDAFQGDWLERSWFVSVELEFAQLISFLLVVGLSILVSTSIKKAGDYLLLLLLMFPVMPMLVIGSHKGGPIEFMLMVLACYLVVMAISRVPGHILPKQGLRAFRAERIPLLVMMTAILFVGLNLVFGGLSHLNFDIDRVYEFRRAATDTRGALLPYLLTNLVGVLFGLGTAVAMSRENYRAVALFVLLSILIFGLTSFKSHLFVVIFSVAMYLVFSRSVPALSLVLGAVLVLVVTTLAYFYDSELVDLGALTIRRVFFAPAYVNFLYYDYFSASPFMYWADSRVSLGLVGNPYQLPTPQVIANNYTGIDMMYRIDRYNNANTGFLGAGYAHSGFVGMIVYSVIVGVLIRVANLLQSKIGIAATVSGISYFFVMNVFLSSDLLTCLISHGGVLFLLIAIFSSSDQRTVKSDATNTSPTDLVPSNVVWIK